MREQVKTSAGTQLRANPVLLGVLAALTASILLSALTGAVVYFSSLGEGVLPIATTATSMLSVFVGGAYAGKRANSLGWLHGGLSGLAFVGVLAVLGWLALPGTPVAGALGARLAYGFVVGSAGGVFGVNL